jgi:hypothetical protein
MLRGNVWLLFMPVPPALFPGMFSFRPSAARPKNQTNSDAICKNIKLMMLAPCPESLDTLMPYSFMICLQLSSHPHPDLLHTSSPQVLYALFNCTMHATCPTSNSLLLGHLYIVRQRVQIMKLLTVQPVPSSCYFLLQVLLWLRQLVTGLSQWKPRSVCVEFVVDKVALGYGFLRVLWFSPVSTILLGL